MKGVSVAEQDGTHHCLLLKRPWRTQFIAWGLRSLLHALSLDIFVPPTPSQAEPWLLTERRLEEARLYNALTVLCRDHWACGPGVETGSGFSFRGKGKERMACSETRVDSMSRIGQGWRRAEAWVAASRGLALMGLLIRGASGN